MLGTLIHKHTKVFVMAVGSPEGINLNSHGLERRDASPEASPVANEITDANWSQIDPLRGCCLWTKYVIEFMKPTTYLRGPPFN